MDMLDGCLCAGDGCFVRTIHDVRVSACVGRSELVLKFFQSCMRPIECMHTIPQVIAQPMPMLPKCQWRLTSQYERDLMDLERMVKVLDRVRSFVLVKC